MGWVALGRKIKANCALVGPGSLERGPSMEVIITNSSLYLSKFRKKQNGKLRTARSASAIID